MVVFGHYMWKECWPVHNYRMGGMRDLPSETGMVFERIFEVLSK